MSKIIEIFNDLFEIDGKTVHSKDHLMPGGSYTLRKLPKVNAELVLKLQYEIVNMVEYHKIALNIPFEERKKDAEST